MNKIQRYILKELISPFIAGFLFFTLLLVLPKLKPLVSLSIEKNIPVWIVIKLFILIIPATTVLTFPMGTLFGALFSLGRLSSDSEIIAMRATGISLWSICKPLLLFGFFMVGFLFLFINFVMSRANLEYKTLYANVVYSSPGILLEEQTFVNLPGSKKQITALEFNEDTQEMKSVYIYEQKPQEKQTSLIYAARGQWLSNEINSTHIKLNLEDGELIQINDENKEVIERIRFNEMKVNIFTQIKQIQKASVGLREQSIFEVNELIKKQTEKKIKISPIVFVEFHKKLSLPLACLAFIIISIPLAITNVRSGKGASLGMALIIAFAYYVFLNSGEAMGKYGALPPALGMHLPNLVIGSIGILLFLRKIRE